MAEEIRQPTPGMRAFGPLSVVAAICAVIFALALLNSDVEEGIARILVLVVFGASVFDAVVMFREHRPVVASGFVVVALITAPFLFLYVVSSAWIFSVWLLLFFPVALYFLVIAFFVRGPGPDPDADVTPDKRFL